MVRNRKLSRYMQITSGLLSAIRTAILLQLRYQKLGDRRLIETGEVGEVLVCHLLGLNLLSNKIADGIDAELPTPRGVIQYQIKTRKRTKGKRTGEIGAFSRDKKTKRLKPFDYAIYIQFGFNFHIEGVWITTFHDVSQKLLMKTKNKRKTVSTLTPGEFKSIGKRMIGASNPLNLP